MIRRHIALALAGLLAVPGWAEAQTAATAPLPVGQYPVPPSPPSVATPYHPATPYASSHYPSMHYPTSQYPTMSYPSSPATASGRPLTPAEAAAQRQSGLSQSAVEALLQGQGYSRLNGIQADPGSIWVWQADAMKDGRPVRVGVDYRGNVLVIAPEANRPCTTPGVGFGFGGIAVGARRSAADSCRR